MGPLPVSALFNLSGKVALVTGASGNIGAGIARRLHEAGAAVAVHHSGTEVGGQRAEQLVSELGERALVVSGDAEGDAASLCAQTREHFGSIDILVNNAGIQPVGALMDLSVNDVAEMLRVNVGGVIALTAEAARLMPYGGCVVNIASIEGMQPAVGHSHYSASKAAVLMHTRAAANELGANGIRVNAVSPGLIFVDGIEQGWPEGVARWKAACPLGRLGDVSDVADAVLYLASPAARWVTGANLVVDGGVLTHNTW